MLSVSAVHYKQQLSAGWLAGGKVRTGKTAVDYITSNTDESSLETPFLFLELIMLPFHSAPVICMHATIIVFDCSKDTPEIQQSPGVQLLEQGR